MWTYLGLSDPIWSHLRRPGPFKLRLPCLDLSGPGVGSLVLSACAYLGVSRLIWTNLSLSGSIWHYLGLSVAIWTNLGLSVTIWAYLVLSGPTWPYLGVSGSIWTYMGLSVPIWSHLREYDSI